MAEGKKALVLFSGGQDSTTCLGWALSRFDEVQTIGFDYGQRHKTELECRQRILGLIGGVKPAWQARLGADHLINIESFGDVAACALTRPGAIGEGKGGLPNTFVPGRNLVFFTYAAALAWRAGITVLVGGMCDTDYSGYPDCRDNTMKSLQVTLSLGMDEPFRIETPLMDLTKEETWALANSLGGWAFVDLVRKETHTCYEGDRTHFHEWGYGCGECPACKLRARGWAQFAAAHPA